jgi:hypothetical protein
MTDSPTPTLDNLVRLDAIFAALLARGDAVSALNPAERPQFNGVVFIGGDLGPGKSDLLESFCVLQGRRNQRLCLFPTVGFAWHPEGMHPALLFARQMHDLVNGRGWSEGRGAGAGRDLASSFEDAYHAFVEAVALGLMPSRHSEEVTQDQIPYEEDARARAFTAVPTRWRLLVNEFLRPAPALQQQLLVFVVDEVDASPESQRVLFQATRMLAHPRVAFLFVGSHDVLVDYEQSRLRKEGIAEIRSRFLAADNIRRFVAPTQSIWVESHRD